MVSAPCTNLAYNNLTSHYLLSRPLKFYIKMIKTKLLNHKATIPLIAEYSYIHMVEKSVKLTSTVSVCRLATDCAADLFVGVLVLVD